MAVGIAEAFGENFAARYKSTRLPKLKVEGSIKKEIIRVAKVSLKPEDPMLSYMIGGKQYNIVLCEATEELTKRQLKFGFSLQWFKFAGHRMSVDCQDEAMLDQLQPKTAYVLVGKERITPNIKGGDPWRNFRLDGFITMEEIASMKIEDQVLDEL